LVQFVVDIPLPVVEKIGARCNFRWFWRRLVLRNPAATATQNIAVVPWPWTQDSAIYVFNEGGAVKMWLASTLEDREMMIGH
jgi:hypothetical protein